MKIKPKYSNLVKVEFNISDVARDILKHYAEYTKYTESEIIDQMILEEILKDDDFIQYTSQKRYKKKITNTLESIYDRLQYGPEKICAYTDDEWERQKAYIESIYEDLNNEHDTEASNQANTEEADDE